MLLKKNDKIIIIFYVLLAISFSSATLYTSTTFEDLPAPTWVLEKLTSLEFEKTLEIEQEKLFQTMSDIENFPIILPKTFVSVNILEINENKALGNIIIIVSHLFLSFFGISIIFIRKVFILIFFSTISDCSSFFCQ